jgi:hypothetical protein
VIMTMVSLLREPWEIVNVLAGRKRDITRHKLHRDLDKSDPRRETSQSDQPVKELPRDDTTTGWWLHQASYVALISDLGSLESSRSHKEKERTGTPDIEEGQELEPMDSMDADEEAISEMMGFGGFGTTKVGSKAHLTPSLSKISQLGQRSDRKSARSRTCEETEDLASVYEPV